MVMLILDSRIHIYYVISCNLLKKLLFANYMQLWSDTQWYMLTF